MSFFQRITPFANIVRHHHQNNADGGAPLQIESNTGIAFGTGTPFVSGVNLGGGSGTFGLNDGTRTRPFYYPVYDGIIYKSWKLTVAAAKNDWQPWVDVSDPDFSSYGSIPGLFLADVTGANRNVTGFGGVGLPIGPINPQIANGFYVGVLPGSSFSLVLKHLSASSNTLGRLYCPGGVDYTIPPGGVVFIQPLDFFSQTGIGRFAVIASESAAPSIPKAGNTNVFPSISADQNNWNPAGLGTTQDTTLIITMNAANRLITGIAAQPDGYRVWCYPLAQTLTLAHLSGSSSAANQIVCPGGVNYALPNRSGVGLVYDGTNNLWRLLDQ